MPYMEGEFPTVVYGDRNSNGNNNGMGDWSWIIGLAIIGALFGGFGGNGFGGGNRGGFGGFGCWESPATQSDLAAGFNNSAVLSSLNDIKLGQAQAINYNNQGFAGLNQTITNGFAGVNNSVCTLGYQQAQLVNGLSRELSDCCCKTQVAIQDLKYSNERQTCDLINVSNQNTRAILDYLTNEKIEGLRAENVALKGQISNDRQSAFIIDSLAPKCPQPAYVVQPPQQVTFPTNCCGNIAYANFGGYNNGGCGASIQ